MLSSRLVASSAILLLGGCDLFSDVTIPAADSTDPVAWAAVWVESSYVSMSSGSGALSYTVTDPDKTYLALAAIVDGGGAHSVTMSAELIRYCDLGGGFSQVQRATYAPVTETQSGSVGDTVSDGVYTAHGIRFGSLSCSSGTLTSARLIWSVSGEDFHGNTDSHGWAELNYVP